MLNPYAVYVNCDGAMDYTRGNFGGVGFIISFPDSIPLDPIQISIGRYTGGNIERLELEALIQAMKKTLEVFEKHYELLKNINQIIFVTDRYGLREEEKTSAYKIREWRKNNWKNYEGKPIKNHKLLDELDKTRKKLSDKLYAKILIEYKPRKQNKMADKLAKTGKKEGLIKECLSKKGEKIGKRKFDGSEIIYKNLRGGDKIHINIFRKDPVQDEWEIWAEVCNNTNTGNKLKIYTDDNLASRLQRGNEYIVKIKKVYSHHIHIFRKMEKINK